MAQKKKLQVFISSTYSDLREERQAAVEAVLNAGHIPAGMELFAAGNESQMKVIKRWIDESDIYMLILGGRYGSIEARTQKSYIHLEYEYAIAKGKPLFAVVIDEEGLEKKGKRYGSSVIERKNRKRFKQFRELVYSKMVRFCNDPKDIKVCTHESIRDLMNRNEFIGWIPGQDVADHIFHFRESDTDPSFVSMLQGCKELWVVGKDCHGLLTTYFDQIQQAIAEKKRFRFLIVDHSNKSLLNTMAASSITRPESKQRKQTAQEALKILRRLLDSASKGVVKVKLANFLPTCTCTIFDGNSPSGRMTIENYGYKISSGRRLRMYITRKKAPQTFAFYIQQFNKMWDAADLLDRKTF